MVSFITIVINIIIVLMFIIITELLMLNQFSHWYESII